MNPITKGAVVNVTATLKRNNAPFAIALDAVVTARITSVDGISVFLPPTPVLSDTAGSSWPVGVIVLPLDNVQTNALPVGDILLQVTVNGVTWVIPMEVVALGGGQSALFTYTAGVAALRESIAAGVGSAYFPIASMTDDFLWGKLLAAEAQCERDLKCFFSAVEVIPDDAPQSEIDDLESSGTRYVQESAFDFESNMFMPDEFGFLALGHRPVQQVRSVQIKIPTPGMSSYAIPADWMRLDKKYGLLRFYPTNTSALAIGGAYGSTLSFGGTYPNAIRIRYVAGLKNASGTLSSSAAVVWHDLVDLVKKVAVLNMINTAFPASSGSISADGLSQSKSVDTSKYQETIDALMFGPKGANGGLFTAIHGVVMGVLG